jgi:3-methyladenine DNA glycosylase/8-oxoguanine DNA glycosylase
MYLPPGPQQVRRIADWEWHRLGVDGNRRRTVRAVAAVGDSLERIGAEVPAADLDRALRSVPGVGPWTVAETLQRAVGHPDAVSVGDYHLAAFVGRALTGRPVDDAQMLELLEPYGGQRYRAVRMLEISGFTAPRFGPRMTVQDMRAL